MTALDVWVKPELYESFANDGHDHSQYFAALDHAVSRVRRLHFDFDVSYRIRRNVLVVGHNRLVHLLDSFFRSEPDSSRWSAPWLEELTIRVTAISGGYPSRPDDPYPLHDVLLRFHAPQLRYCDVEALLIGRSMRTRTYETLTTLVLKDCVCPSTSAFVSHLSCFPNLIHLAIRSLKLHQGIDGDELIAMPTGIPPPTIDITFPHLMMVEIQCHGDDLAFVSRVLRHLFAPPGAVAILIVASLLLSTQQPFPEATAALEGITRHFHTSLDNVPTSQHRHYIVYTISVGPMLDANPRMDVPQSILLQ